MLFSSNIKPWMRVLSSLPVLGLSVMMVIIWADVIFSIFGRVISAAPIEHSNYIFEVPTSIRFVYIIGGLFTSIFFFLTCVSFYLSVRTDPGSVPSSYRKKHESLIPYFVAYYESIHSVGADFSALIHYTEVMTEKYEERNVPSRLTSDTSTYSSVPPSLPSVDILLRATVPPFEGSTEEYMSHAVESMPDNSHLDNDGVRLLDRNTRGVPPSKSHTNLKKSRTSVIRSISLSLFDSPGPHDPMFCRKCVNIKPPRTHHCSLCNRCVLKMDHHCPWIGNCVGFSNYKYFFLMILHGFIASCIGSVLSVLLLSGSLLPYKYSHLTSNGYDNGASGIGEEPSIESATLAVNSAFSFSRVALFEIVAFVFCFALCGSTLLLGAVHLYLILNGKTTLETSIFTSYNPYGGSKSNNWCMVMGFSPLYWFLPVFPREVKKLTRRGTYFVPLSEDDSGVVCVYDLPPIPRRSPNQELGSSNDIRISVDNLRPFT